MATIMIKSLIDKQKNDTAHIDIIMNNPGYGLFTDLVLEDFILRYNLVQKIRIHWEAIFGSFQALVHFRC